MMKLEIEPYKCLCALNVFKINGKTADEEDFVKQYDHDPDNAKYYGCGDMCCDVKVPNPEVLKKYGITIAEYQEIADKLCAALDFGCCGWCV